MTAPALWAADAPQLAARHDLAYALELLEAYRPANPHLERERARMLAFCAEHPDALHRSSLEGHLTASALVVDRAAGRGLLTHHRKLNRWLQMGGHCDGDANLPAVALREAEEESGIAGLRIDPRPVQVDVHPIPALPGVPEHLHLDTSYLVYAPPGARAEASDESHAVAWFTPPEAAAMGLEANVLRLFELGLG